MHLIVNRPLITEKSLTLAGKGLYTFKVSLKADKSQIRREINRLYKVKVTDIRTVTMHGKTRRVGRKMTVIQKSNWKKAIVRLMKGQKIDAFEVTGEGEKK